MVSAIVPTYNRAHTVTLALDSILAQSLPPTEIIVVDDGSTDSTPEALRHWQNLHTSQITQKQIAFKVVRTENRGVSAARNTALAQATQEWVALLDSDDQWATEKLQKQFEWIKNHKATPLVHTEEIWIRNGLRVNPKKKHKKQGGRIFKNCLPLCCISPSASLIKKDLLIQLGGFNESLPVCEDYDLWLKICAQYNVGFVDEPLTLKFGGHDDQLSHKYFAMDYWRVKSLIEILDHPSLSKEERILVAATGKKKCQILTKGYLKHNNLEPLDHVTQWLKIFEKFLELN